MFPFYFSCFLIFCLLAFWAWYRILNHKSHRAMLVCVLLSVMLFGAFCVRDAQDVRLRVRQAVAERNDPTYYDDPVHRRESPYFECFYRKELERFRQYQWNSGDWDWKNPQNLQTAADVLQNVYWGGFVPEKQIDSAQSPDFAAIKEDPVGNLGQLFELTGWSVHAEQCEDPQVRSLFLPDETQFDLMWVSHSFTSQDAQTIDYILLEPCLKRDAQRYAEPHDTPYGEYGILIGMTQDHLPVFVSQ